MRPDSWRARVIPALLILAGLGTVAALFVGALLR
jgi:hypothetical protein